MAPTWTDYSGQTYELKAENGELWYRAVGEGDDKWKQGRPGWVDPIGRRKGMIDQPKRKRSTRNVINQITFYLRVAKVNAEELSKMEPRYAVSIDEFVEGINRLRRDFSRNVSGHLIAFK